jgi:hypothetical protein
LKRTGARCSKEIIGSKGIKEKLGVQGATGSTGEKETKEFKE